jgi:hypothetical protein
MADIIAMGCDVQWRIHPWPVVTSEDVLGLLEAGLTLGVTGFVPVR